MVNLVSDSYISISLRKEPKKKRTKPRFFIKPNQTEPCSCRTVTPLINMNNNNYPTEHLLHKFLFVFFVFTTKLKDF